MRDRNSSRLTPEETKGAPNAAVWTQDVLRDDAERNIAFCVPPKHEHRSPQRQDTHMIARSRLPEPERSTIARERDCVSPMTRSVTRDAWDRMGMEEESPHARRMPNMSASCM